MTTAPEPSSHHLWFSGFPEELHLPPLWTPGGDQLQGPGPGVGWREEGALRCRDEEAALRRDDEGGEPSCGERGL